MIIYHCVLIANEPAQGIEKSGDPKVNGKFEKKLLDFFVVCRYHFSLFIGNFKLTYNYNACKYLELYIHPLHELYYIVKEIKLIKFVIKVREKILIS